VARREAILVPLARMAGVRTPELLVMDESCAILPAPYTIYERVHGATLGLLDLEPHDTPAVWRDVGRDLALLHMGIPRTEATAELESAWVGDPDLWIDELAETGHFTGMEARWLTHWLERLETNSPTPVTDHCLHGDNQTTNIMVGVDRLEYRALIDWGSAGWGDPAFDFAGIPLRAVPYLLEGYREITPLENDDTAEARILRRHLTLALHNLRGEPDPTRSWAERPLTFFAEVMRFLLETSDARWRAFV
jgi:aminoglycoside phosphotransferase (APT) family kinase protein